MIIDQDPEGQEMILDQDHVEEEMITANEEEETTTVAEIPILREQVKTLDLDLQTVFQMAREDSTPET